MSLSLAGALVASAVGDPAGVSHGGNPNFIHACVGPNGHVLIVSPTNDCHTIFPVGHWNPVDWSITGPSGPKGATGATGATGAQGTTGATGAQGATGVTGASGPSGATGHDRRERRQRPLRSFRPAGRDGRERPLRPAGRDRPLRPAGRDRPLRPAGRERCLRPDRSHRAVRSFRSSGATGVSGQKGTTGTSGSSGASGPSGPAGGGGAGIACSADSVAGGTNNVNVENADDNYASLVRQTNPNDISTDNVDTFLCGGNLSNLSVTASGSPGAGNDYDITVRINNADTALNCTISDAATTCSDPTSSVDVDPGDEVNVETNPSDDPTARNFDWSADVDPHTNVYP